MQLSDYCRARFPDYKIHFTFQARPLLGYALDNEEFEGLVDPRLEKNYVESEVFRLIEIAAACVRHSSAKRPRMGQVLRAHTFS